jgi:hypothetical protein
MVYVCLRLKRFTDKVLRYKSVYPKRGLFAMNIKSDIAVALGVYPRLQIFASGCSVYWCNPSCVAKIRYLIPTLKTFNVFPLFSHQPSPPFKTFGVNTVEALRTAGAIAHHTHFVLAFIASFASNGFA